MLIRKLFRTMRQYRAQFISMVIMVTLGIGMFVGFNMEWAGIERNTSSFFEKSGFADYRLISETGYSENVFKKVANIKGVEAATRFLSANTDVLEGNGDSLALCITTNFDVSGFVLISGEEYNALDKDGIWISDQYAEKNKIKLGDEVTMLYGNYRIKGKIRGLVKAAERMICVRDETQLMPDFKTYGFAYISPVMYEDVVGFDYYPQINVISNLSKKEITEAVDKALGRTTAILTKDEIVSYAEAEGEIKEGKTMGSILPALFLLIGLLTMVTTMHRLTVKEKTQIGTLKALGFHDSSIIFHYTSYAFMVSVIGAVLGIGMGFGIARYIMDPNGTMGTYLDMPEWDLVFPWFCYVAIAVIIFALTLVGYFSVRKMLHGTAADALRPYMPKKVKALFIEKTKFFHKLSFGSRWNMRDIVRHKSRTAMSLIGIIGCSILIVASLGMRDTMDEFLSMYYDTGLNYSSRIFLSEDASDAEKNSIIEKYHGDYGAAVSVKMDDKTVSLDIYDLSHDSIRFSNEDAQSIKLKDNGAYLCMRLAERFGLKEGDTFKISPFGTDETYELAISGVFRSVSENIVITNRYADKIKIPYAVDSVYTDIQKNDIPVNNIIKSVQSKQMIVDSFETFTDIMDVMIYILVGGALLLGIVVLYNLGTMSYTERYREMATLKVLGFRDKKIGRLLIGQNFILSVIGVIVGIPLGALTLAYLMEALAGEYEMIMVIEAPTYFVSVLLTVGMSLFVSLLVSRKNRKINMVEALKGME